MIRSPVVRVARLAAAVLLVSTALPAAAQPVAGRAARVGLLGATSAGSYARQVEALRQGFRDLGYVEGQNLVIEARWADGHYERLPALAAELVRLQPDVIVTSGPGTRALREATTTISIVMAVSSDAVADGLVASLARPGGNITGSTSFAPEISAKRLEMLKEAVPRLARVGVVLNPDGRGRLASLEALRTTATALNVEVLEVPARAPREFDDAFARLLRQHADGLVVVDDSVLVANTRRLGELSAARRVPGIGGIEYAEGGGLLTYGVDFPALWGRAPYFVDRILKGASPATIPVERASKFTLTVNLAAARALGLTLPPGLLYRADRVVP